MNHVDVATDALLVKGPYGGLYELKPCLKHKGYRGVGKPRSNCDHCWTIYLAKHPNAVREEV